MIGNEQFVDATVRSGSTLFNGTVNNGRAHWARSLMRTGTASLPDNADNADNPTYLVGNSSLAPSSSKSNKRRRFDALTHNPSRSRSLQQRPTVYGDKQPQQLSNNNDPLLPYPAITNVKQELHSDGVLYTMDDSTNYHTPLSIDEATLGSIGKHDASSSLTTTQQRAEQIMAEQEAEYISNKGTERAYNRHVKNYVAWWESDQLNQENEALRVPAHPITASKVVVFLNYEFDRKKKSSSGDSIENTKVGVSSIKQAISGLDWYRRRHHRDPEYQTCAEAQRSLCEDPDIRRMEEMASAREPKRLEQSQEEKAKGVLSKTFTEDELIRMSADLLCKTKFISKKSKKSAKALSPKPGKASIKTIHKALRNRAMLIFTTSMTLRGDDTRPILLSDLQVKDVPLVDVSMDNRTKTLIVCSNEGKTNTTGRLDQHPAFRHRNPDLCAISALAYYLFARFHLMYPSTPNFTPKFLEDGESRAGPYGFRDWYSLRLFALSTSQYDMMTSDNHREQFNDQKDELGLSHRQVTHVGRSFGASIAMERGASSDSVRALGLWSQPGSFDVYVQSLPTDAMVALAGFNGRQPGSYFIARDVLEPPDSLLGELFPWVEEEEKELSDRVIKNSQAIDVQLTQFLGLLRYCRRVLLQDAAVQYQRYPNAPIFQHYPFNSTTFCEFSLSATIIIQRAEDEYRQCLAGLNLPERTISGVRGLMEANNMRQQEYIQELRAENQLVRQHLNHQNQKIDALVTVQMQMADPQSRKRLQNVLDDAYDIRPKDGPAIKRARHLDSDLSLSNRTNSEPMFTSPEPELMSNLPGPSLLDAGSTTTTVQQVSPPLITSTRINIPASTAPTMNLQRKAISTSTAPLAQVPTPAWFDDSEEGPPIASGSGRLYPWSMFPIHPGSDARLRASQMEALTILEQKIGADKLRRVNHKFEWIGNEWVPDFPGFFMPAVQVSPSREEIWTEHTEGINGRLSISTLKALWETRWRRGNAAIKAEGVRRSKLIKLIEMLMKPDHAAAKEA
ncbi:hypothetical protein CVT24_013262 [Panaeolus cyanescens]|uniref:Ndc10 domain-containing protein n=1 Tax=Panaeolus cyanescens TaxID=181874 RepID=A0A409WAN5_9AGAR|nr:hypothetical protein CVT24_013262 [Panaeolus cyanescens]